MPEKVHVIIVGAGISGLSAAKTLTEHGLDVLVLEATDRIGGRVWTLQNDQVGFSDLGGAYIRPGQNHILRLLKEFDLYSKLYSADSDGQNLYYDAIRKKRLRFSGMPNLGLLAWLDLNRVFRLLDKYGHDVLVDAPWSHSFAEEWDQMTVKQFVLQNTSTAVSREYLRVFVSTMVSSEWYQVSLLFFVWYIKQCGGTKAMFASGGPEFKLVGGAQQIAHCLADRLGRSKVLLNQPVCQLQQRDDSVTTVTLKGDEYVSEYIIMATPPAVQQKIAYFPPLPPMRNQLIQRAPQGSVFKCILFYKTAFWRDLNLNGCLVLIGSDERVPMPFTFDDTKPDGTLPAILGFVPADKALILASITSSKEERCRLIADSFAAAFNCEEARNVHHYEERNWGEDQFCGGGYMATPHPGFLVRFGSHLRLPVGRMHFAGTECSTSWAGYMNGAVQSGERAAREVLFALGRLAADQVDQIEPTSSEYPPEGPHDASLLEQFAPSARGFLLAGLISTLTAASLAACFALRYGRT